MGSYVFQVEYTCFLILRTLLDLRVLSNCVNVTLLKQKQLLSDYLYFKIYVYLQWFSMGRGKILSSGDIGQCLETFFVVSTRGMEQP